MDGILWQLALGFTADAVSYKLAEPIELQARMDDMLA